MGNGLFHLLITVFTFFAVTANFCLAALEPVRAVMVAAERAGDAEERIDSVIPSPAEEPALLTRTDDPRYVPLRTRSQRVFDPCKPGGVYSAAFAFCQPSFRINSNFDCINVKNTILLKLRI
jgi:hypothetical protein